MAEPTTTFRIQALIKGIEGVDKLKNSVNRLQNTARPAAADINKLRLAANLLGRHSTATENDLRDQVTVLRDLRANVQLTSTAYKQLSADLKLAEQRLEKINMTGKKGGGNKGAIGAAVVGSALLGPEALAGTLIGASVGGLPGAFVGGTIGTATKQVRELTAGLAQYAAKIKRMEIALKGVTKNSLEYARAQQVIQTVSEELNVPILEATTDFTKLAASVIGAGGSVRDAELVFRGVSEAIKATGGEALDVQSAIRAMSQIFGKGKVSAEELQGQLGERLPGAVVKFAEATGRTLPQLAKDLRDGTVGLNDVMKFVVRLSQTHRDAALAMADSTEEAGARMKVALDELRLNLGDFFKPAGAMMQEFSTNILNMVNNVFRLNKAFGLLKKGGVGSQELVNQAHRMTTAIMETRGINPLNAFKRKEIFDESLEALVEQKLKDLGITFDAEKGVITNFADPKGDFKGKGEEGLNALQKYAEKVKDVNGQINDVIVGTFNKMEDALVDFVMTGKLKFNEFAKSVIRDITRIVIRQAIIKPLVGGLFPAAKGAVFAQNGIKAFARGGVIDSPHVFPFAKGGTGLLGEAGPEAILPLRRGKGGRLGVETSGTSNSVVVNVDASGNPSVQGDAPSAQQLGRLIGAAVSAELIKQQRPGGLLAPA